MTVEEAKKREASFLRSNSSTSREYGIAYRDIVKMWNESSTPWLSEEVDLNDAAHKYYNLSMSRFKTLGDQKYFLRAKAASDMFVSQILSKSETKSILRDLDIKSLEDAKSVLKTHPKFRNLSPEVVLGVIDELSSDNAE
jgi:hypothetical protein